MEITDIRGLINKIIQPLKLLVIEDVLKGCVKDSTITH